MLVIFPWPPSILDSYWLARLVLINISYPDNLTGQLQCRHSRFMGQLKLSPLAKELRATFFRVTTKSYWRKKAKEDHANVSVKP